MSKLFTPYTLGRLTLQNKVVMAPMTRSRAINNVPNDLIAKYYEQRGTAGLIITEGTSPSPNGLGYARIPGLFSAQQVDGWKKVTTAAHQNGAKIFAQLMHTGRITHPGNLPEGGQVLAPSAIQLKTTKLWVDGQGMLDVPVAKAMTIEDIKHTIQEHVEAARNAINAGFDGVEIHGANGYLVNQFISPVSNHRTDAYGGSVENRSRFVIELAAAVATAIGKEKVGVRLSPFGVNNELGAYDSQEETYLHIATGLQALGVAYVHLVDHSSMGAPAVPESVVKGIRDQFTNTLILSGNYNAQRAETALTSGAADLVAFGRPFISNPDLVNKLKNGIAYNELRADFLYTPGEEGYLDYSVASVEKAVVA